MQKAFKGQEAREPFVVHLRLDFRLAEGLRVVQVEIDRAHQPPEGVQAEEGERADEQAGHATETRHGGADNACRPAGWRADRIA